MRETFGKPSLDDKHVLNWQFEGVTVVFGTDGKGINVFQKFPDSPPKKRRAKKSAKKLPFKFTLSDSGEYKLITKATLKKACPAAARASGSTIVSERVSP